MAGQGSGVRVNTGILLHLTLSAFYQNSSKFNSITNFEASNESENNPNKAIMFLALTDLVLNSFLIYFE